MRDIPRGKGYDKASMTKYKYLLETTPAYQAGVMSANQAARHWKLLPDFFVRSWEKYFPNDELKYYANTCQYCKRKFAYSVKTQKFCSPKCGSDSKRDKEYFGGNRKKTVGLSDRICQICGVFTKKGLAAHHTYGKVNDPKGKHLVALCPGCHDLVTKLGVRNFITDSETWESLITYAIMRKYGPDKSLNVKVEIARKD